MKKSILSLALLSSCLVSLPATAAVSWSITTLTGSNTSPTPAYGNTRDYSASGASVSVSAFSATGGSNISGTQSQIDADAGRNSRLLESAFLSIYTPSNGLGVVNRDGSSNGSVALNSASGPDNNEYINNGSEHSMDNQGRSDVMLLTFTDVVALNSLKLGWASGDSDLFVLAWIGSGNPTAALTTKTFADIAADSFNGGNGWSLVANLSNVGTASAKSFNTATTPVSSSYWLVGTGGFTSAATGGGVNSGDSGKAFGTYGANYDYVKLAGIGGITPPRNDVPEPGTLGLAGAALFAITALRRRRAAA